MIKQNLEQNQNLQTRQSLQLQESPPRPPSQKGQACKWIISWRGKGSKNEKFTRHENWVNKYSPISILDSR